MRLAKKSASVSLLAYADALEVALCYGWIDGGLMQPAGLREVERAKADGRWDAAYDSHRTAAVPQDLEAALARNPDALKFFATLNAQNRYAILFRIQTARTAAARAKRIGQLVEMLLRREVFHP